MTTKICRLCDTIKPLDDFNKSSGVKDGFANECKECRHNQRNELNFERITTGTKHCNSCNSTKDVSEFNSDSKNSDGLRSTCKQCTKNTVEKYNSTFEGYIQNLFKDLISNAKKRNVIVNITKQDIINKYHEQAGLCKLSYIYMTHNKINGLDKANIHVNNPYNISVDRIDSSKPYTKDNIQLICARVNIMKSNIPQNKFLEICKLIVKNKSRKCVDIAQLT